MWQDLSSKEGKRQNQRMLGSLCQLSISKRWKIWIIKVWTIQISLWWSLFNSNKSLSSSPNEISVDNALNHSYLTHDAIDISKTYDPITLNISGSNESSPDHKFQSDLKLSNFHKTRAFKNLVNINTECSEYKRKNSYRKQK